MFKITLLHDSKSVLMRP